MTISSIRWQIDEEIEKALTNIQVPSQCPPGKLYVPKPFRTQLITWAHSSLTSGHPGESRTRQLLVHRYWWESMTQDIHSFVSSCSICAQCKTPKTLPAGKLMPLPIPNRPWSHIAVDFITDLPESQGFTTILTVIDRFSRGVRFIPFNNPQRFSDNRGLVPVCIPSFLDSQGYSPQFTSQVWAAFFEHLGVSESFVRLSPTVKRTVRKD